MANITAEQRDHLEEIRVWAKANGHSLWSQDRVPPRVKAMFEAAHGGAQDAGGEGGGAGEDEDGPDWGEAARVSGAGALDELEEQLAGGGEAEAGGPPPPADLDEARERLGGAAKRDRPAWAKPAGRQRQPKEPAKPPKVTPAVAADIAGKLTLLLVMPAATWASMDPYCGKVFADNLDTIVAKAVPLLCQSSDVVAFFSKTSMFFLVWDLLAALQPVGLAVYHHHVAEDKMLDRHGQVVDAEWGPDGSLRPVAEPAPDSPGPGAYPAAPMVVTGHVPPPRPA